MPPHLKRIITFIIVMTELISMQLLQLLSTLDDQQPVEMHQQQ